MALHVERVGGVTVRMRASLTPEKGLTAGQLLAYAVSGLAASLFGFHVAGPLLARVLLGH